jgi:hypothetical protein
MASSISQYRDPIDGGSLTGWPGALKELSAQLPSQKDYVVLIMHRPMNAFLFQDFDWFRSTVLAAQRKLSGGTGGRIGHFQVAWACATTSHGKKHFGITGQSGEMSEQSQKMVLDQGYGMATLFANFTDGYLESSAASSQRLTKSARRYGFDWLAFEISSSQCRKGLQFLNQYINQASYRNFSFDRNPFRLQGGGCTSFASALLYHFGVVGEQTVKSWQTVFSIPRAMVANPEGSVLPQDTELPAWLYQDPFRQRRVGLLKMGLMPNWSSTRTHIRHVLFDSEKIIHTVFELRKQAFRESLHSFPATYQLPSRRQAHGLRRDPDFPSSVIPSSRYHSVTVDHDLHPEFADITHRIRRQGVGPFLFGELAGVGGLILKNPLP